VHQAPVYAMTIANLPVPGEVLHGACCMLNGLPLDTFGELKG
jgi:hypothetical protein